MSSATTDRFGAFGGRYVPETLIPALDELEEALAAALADPRFQAELDHLLVTYVGRPSALTDAPRRTGRFAIAGVPAGETKAGDWFQSSTSVDASQSGRVHGLLRRDRKSRLTPMTADDDGLLGFGLQRTLYQDPTTWPATDTPDRRAAYAYISAQLGADDIRWAGAPVWARVGEGRFPAHMGEGTCTFKGPGGRIWYATVDTGTSDQILLIYTLSARGTQEEEDAIEAAIQSLQRR